MIIEAILNLSLKILETLEYLVEDQSQKGDARKEANNLAHKMQ